MKTSQKQISLFTEEQLTSSPEASHVNHTQWRASDLERKMSDTSGQRCLERFGKFSRHGLWAKTFSALLIGQEGWYSTKCRLIWKLKGTKYNRMYFQLAPSTLHTDEIGYGLLLKTPTKMDGEVSSGKSNPVSGNSGTLAQEIMSGYEPTMQKLGLLPTPTGMMNDCYADKSPNAHLRHTPSIATLAANGMLPTPAASDWKGAYRPESMTNKNGAVNREERLVNIYLKTGQEYNSKTSQLNPPFVLEMMGFPPDWTLQPFLSQSGETSQSKPEETP